MSDAFSERMRLIRFRRKTERPRFRDEFKLVPKWLIGLIIVLYAIAVAASIVVNLKQDNESSAVDYSLHAALLALLRHRIHSLFPGARTAALSLPALFHLGRRPLQLLLQLQMQPASQLPQLQTRGRRNGQILPLLRSRSQRTRDGSSAPGDSGADELDE